jgi:Domain of unknown function (DUF4032)
MIPFQLDYVIEQTLREGANEEQRLLRELAGVRLGPAEAASEWGRVLEHKWFVSERLGRDIGLRVAAVDYFENIHPAPRRARAHAHSGGLPPRLPMMMPLGQRS